MSRGGGARQHSAFPTHIQLRGVYVHCERPPLRFLSLPSSSPLQLCSVLYHTTLSLCVYPSFPLRLSVSAITPLSLFSFSSFSVSLFDLRPWRYLSTHLHSPTAPSRLCSALTRPFLYLSYRCQPHLDFHDPFAKPPLTHMAAPPEVLEAVPRSFHPSRVGGVA